MTVWNTMSPMFTMLCSLTSIGTTLRWRVLPSNFFGLSLLLNIWVLFVYFYSMFLLFKLCIFVLNRFFKESSEEEREHAEKLMEYQVLGTEHIKLMFLLILCILWFRFSVLFSVLVKSNLLFLYVLENSQNKRGGRVKLQSIVMPPSEYDHEEKGDALYGKSQCFIVPFFQTRFF